MFKSAKGLPGLLLLLVTWVMGSLPAAHAIEGIYPDPPAPFARIDAYANDHHRLQERLLTEAYRLSAYVHVPYIWGGQLIGHEDACQRCRLCVERRGIPLKSRKQSCEACQFCGIDCSHLVQRIYDLAWLEFPYANVSLIMDHSDRSLRRRYGLVDIGRDVGLAQRGDILVYEKHMVMLTAHDGLGGGEVIHATMLGDELQLGGIRVERAPDLATFRGPLMRILRHRRFFRGVEIASRHFDPYLEGEVTSELN